MTIHVHVQQDWPILLLALAALFVGSLTEPTPGARTGDQIRGTARQAGFWRVLGWTLALPFLAAIVATWYAARTALYWLARAVVDAFAWVANATAMDDRPIRVSRAAGGRA